MGLVFENITLKNAGDVANLRRGHISEHEIRQIKIIAMVDTGSEALVINEAIRQDLGLDIVGEKPISLADGSVQTCQFTEPVEIFWKDRSAVAYAIILPGIDDVLLGAIPLEEMNVMVDPTKQQLVGIHGDKILYKVY